MRNRVKSCGTNRLIKKQVSFEHGTNLRLLVCSFKSESISNASEGVLCSWACSFN